MKIVLLLGLILGCDNTPASKDTTTPKNYDVAVLFTDEDGYTVKRFRDGGYNRYYVTRNNEMHTSSRIPAGKTSRLESIQTIEKQ